MNALEALDALNSIVSTEAEAYDPEKAKQFYHRLSYSSLNNLHECARRWQLDRFNRVRETTLHTAFGHAVGEAVASIAAGQELEDAVFQAFVTWEVDLLEEIPKSKKSFATAIEAINSFHFLWVNSLGEEWEVLLVDGKPAAELGLRIIIGEYNYRGFVDLVLRNKFTGEIAVLECKTTGNKEALEAQFGNSNQSLGYAVILDKVVPDVSSYTVLHLVYSTSAMQWNVFPVHKSMLKRANWLRDLIYEVRMLEMYQEDDTFPTNGSACTNWGRICPWYGMCDMPTAELVTVMPQLEDDPDERYHYTFTIDELLQQQLENVS